MRAEQSVHLLTFKRGRLKSSGRGLALWFMPMSTSIAEVPVDDRELSFLFHARSSDFQDVNVQGVITYRVASPETLSERIDFSIDLNSGAYRKQPLDQLATMLTELAQQLAIDYLSRADVREILTAGTEPIRHAGRRGPAPRRCAHRDGHGDRERAGFEGAARFGARAFAGGADAGSDPPGGG